LNEHILKDQLVLVYSVLDEMIENGMPMASEINVIQDLIKPRDLDSDDA
jgi:AP-3 complex subunit mu